MKSQILYAAAIALAAASCTRERPAGALLTGFVLDATVENYEEARTKTIVGETNLGDALVLTWEVGEQIGVYGEGVDNVPLTGTNTSPAGKTTFATSGALASVPTCAYYPFNASLDGKMPDALTFTIDENQHYTGPSSIAPYDIKTASGFTEQEDGSYKAVFRQKACVIKIQIDLGGIDGISPDETISGISIVNQDDNGLAGTFSLDITDDASDLYALESISTINIGIAPELGISAGTEATVFAAAAPGTAAGDELYVGIETDSHLVEFCALCKCSFEAGRYYVLRLDNATVSAGYHYVADESNPDSKGVKVGGPMIVDLSGETEPDPVPATEYANCYMIDSEGVYCFDATVIGNGDAGIISGAGFHVETAAISPASVELLWQDTPGFINSLSLGSDGLVTYSAGKNSGNAVIAVRDKDGVILWSWHIWGIGDTPVSDDVYTNQAGATFNVMDRNLGQLKYVTSNQFPLDGTMYVHTADNLFSEAVEALQPTWECMLYQWGRKDPLSNGTTLYNIDGEVIADISASYPVYVPGSAAEAGIDCSVQNPDKLVNAFSLIGSGDWLADNNNLLWGDEDLTNRYTWYSDGQLGNAGAGAGWTDVKTIYDPCPAGYRVANKYTWTGFVGESDGDVTLKSAPAKVWTDGVLSSDQSGEIENTVKCVTTYFEEASGTSLIWRFVPVFCRGFFFKGNSDDAAGSYYPMAGYRRGTDGAPSGFGTQGWYWSSGVSEGDHSAYQLRIGEYSWYDSAPAGYGAGNNVKVNVNEQTDKFAALPVRCVRE